MNTHKQTPEEKLNAAERTLIQAEQKLQALPVESLAAWQKLPQEHYWRSTTTIEEILPQLAILKEIMDTKKDIRMNNFSYLLGCNKPIWNTLALGLFIPFAGFFAFLILGISINVQAVFLIGFLLSIIVGVGLAVRYHRLPKTQLKRTLVKRAKELKQRWLVVNNHLNSFKIPEELAYFVYPLLILMRDDIRKGSPLNLQVLLKSRLIHEFRTKAEKIQNPYLHNRQADLTTYEGTLATISMVLVDKSRVTLQVPYQVQKLYAWKYNRRRTKMKTKTKYKMRIFYFFNIRVAPNKTLNIQSLRETFPKSGFVVEKNVLKLKAQEKYKGYSQRPNINLVKSALKEVFKNIKTS